MNWDDVTQRLKEAGLDDPRREARFLIKSVTGIDPLLSGFETSEALEDAVRKRMDRMPLAKITGRKEFYGRDFIVSSDVLDPRPDSETLIEQALKHCPDTARILDLGTGSGCLLLTLLAEKPDTSGVAVDISVAALSIARQNAQALDIQRVEFIEGDFATCQPDGLFDLLVSNPPYIPTAEVETLDPEVRRFDPVLALDGGTDGCDPYRVILRRMPEFLRKNSHFLLEISTDICDKVLQLAIEAGHKDLDVIPDLAGQKRVLVGRCG